MLVRARLSRRRRGGPVTKSTKKYPMPVDNGDSDHIQTGMTLPRVTLPSTAGDMICLTDLPGCILVFVYPWTGRPGVPNPPNWDDIPGAHGSTAEIEGFRDLDAQFEEFELGIYGLSRQSTDYQREMVERLRVPFPILSDANGEFAAAAALPTFETGGEVYLKRISILLNHGLVENVFYPIPRPEKHARDVLRWFRREMRR
jgi:peroxiredoxin